MQPRQQLLAALGVVQYLPRDRWQLHSAAPAPAVPRPAVAPAPAATALLAQLESAANSAERPVAATPAPAQPAPTAASSAPATVAEPLALALWQAGAEWLFIADASAQLPSSGEQKLLANIARAIQAANLTPLELIEWPLAGTTADADDPHGHDFLAVLFEARLRSRPVKKVLWLAADQRLSARLGSQALATMAGLVQLQLPSLAQMLAEPARKAHCWSQLQPHLAANSGG